MKASHMKFIQKKGLCLILMMLAFNSTRTHSAPTSPLYPASSKPNKQTTQTPLKRPPFANPNTQQTLMPAAVKQASIRFQFKQMGVLADGHFGQVSANIHFDPANLNKTITQIRIPLESIDSGNSDANTLLASPLWFNTKHYPHASWSLGSVTPLIAKKANGESLFAAEGFLTIKGHREPIRSVFVYQASTRQIKGDFVINRLSYGIGEGEWADTSVIDRDIRVFYEFTLP